MKFLITILFFLFGSLFYNISSMQDDLLLIQDKLSQPAIIQQTNNEITVLQENKEEVGRVRFNKFDRPICPCVIELLHVQKKFRNHGIGSVLLKSALYNLISKGCNKIYLWASAFDGNIQEILEKWYKKHGFISYHENNGYILNMVYETQKQSNLIQN